MCEFCTEHGEGKKWYLLMKHFSDELLHQELNLTQQEMVGRPVELELFVGAVHTDQLQAVRKQRWISEVHLVVQPASNEESDVALFMSESGRRILMNVGKPHVDRIVLAQELLMVRHIENRDTESIGRGLQFILTP